MAPTIDQAAQELLFTQANTPANFTDAPVADSDIYAAYELMKWAPTAFNAQPLRILLVNSPEKREALVERVMPGNQERVRNASQVAIIAADTKFFEHMGTLNPGMANVPLWQNSEFTDNLADSQTWLQLGYLTLALRGEGLGVYPMTGIHNDQINAEFFADGQLRTVAVLAIGHIDETAARPRNARHDIETAIKSI